MIAVYLYPAAVAVAALLLASAVHRSLPPRAAALTLTGTLVVAAAATVWSLAMLGLDFLVDRTRWCRDLLRGHVHVPTSMGVAALAIVSWGTVAAVKTAHGHWRATRTPAPDGDLLVLDTTSLLAYAVPGRHPHVVVSEGMLDLLDADERNAMLAHEFAHLRHHHHRFLALSELAASFVPPLRFVARRVRFATERWADQDAAREVGDPTIVARAIARAALEQGPSTRRALALSDTDVTARVEDLMSNQLPGRLAGPVPTAIFALVVLSGTASAIQLHHVIDFVRTFCVP